MYGNMDYIDCAELNGFHLTTDEESSFRYIVSLKTRAMDNSRATGIVLVYDSPGFLDLSYVFVTGIK
jgi:hypothetical protein